MELKLFINKFDSLKQLINKLANIFSERIEHLAKSLLIIISKHDNDYNDKE